MYTTVEASTILGIQPKTVTRYIERGILQAQKKGRDYLIEEGELERFKHERRRRGRPERIFAEWQRMRELEAAGLYDPATDTHGLPPVIQEKHDPLQDVR